MNLLNVCKRDCRHQEYKKNISNGLTIANEIQNLYAAVSRGTLYICSCCDQLWYKHSVVNPERLRVSNPNARKYLLSKKSVNGIEWICQSCDKNLKKNEIPSATRPFFI